MTSTRSSSEIHKPSDELKAIGGKTETPIDDAEFQSKKKWLVHNFSQDIKSYWKSTSVLGLKENKASLQDLLNDWPGYKDPKGYESKI